MESRGVNWWAVVAFLLVMAVAVVGLFLFYRWLTSPVIAGNEELARAQIAASVEIARAKAAGAAERWATIKVVGVVAVVLFALAWVVIAWLRYKAEKKNLTIEEIIEKGRKWLLEREGYVTVWADGGGLQRRDGSPNRVVLAWFSSEQKRDGWWGRSRGIRFIAVLNDDWDHRMPLPENVTFLQAWAMLHDIETWGFSMEKTAEGAAMEKLGEFMRGQKAAAEAASNIPGLEG